MTSQPLIVLEEQCWHRMGVWGDRTCPELPAVTHCHNCPVFAGAGRRFLEAAPPEEYAEEWTEQLAEPEEETVKDLTGALVFRLTDEWLAVPVNVLAEVTHLRKPHRIPHRGGLLAGLVNIRGELQLCVRLDKLLGIEPRTASRPQHPRMISLRREADCWVFAADEVDQVCRVSAAELTTAPPTLTRSASRLTRGVFTHNDRTIGLLDDARLFTMLRERVR